MLIELCPNRSATALICTPASSHGHGRVETRTLQTLTAARGIGFPYARQVVRITRERLVNATGQRTAEVVYAICSLPFEQARRTMIARWLRQHWRIENSAHWVRDVTFDEDRSTTRTGTAPQVMASLRNTAINLHRIAGADNIAEPAASPPSAPTADFDSSPAIETPGHKRATRG
jgi:hypothetical protein